MVGARNLERLTASDMFLLLWDDFGWSGDIGALAILDGTSLLDREGRVRIEDVRRHLEARLHLVPRFRQRLYRPKRGLGWPLWVDAASFDLADHVRVHPLPAPGDSAQLLHACEQLAQRRLDPARPLWELWLIPGLPARRMGALFKVHHAIADGMAGVATVGALLDLTPDARSRRHGRRRRSRPQASCYATTCADAARGSAEPCGASPIPAGRWVGRDTVCRRGVSSWPSGAPHAPASTARSVPSNGWPSSAAVWTLRSGSPTPMAPRSMT
jgi:Wax ester synthase-like Acyl-CoA acyltransferase domain